MDLICMIQVSRRREAEKLLLKIHSNFSDLRLDPFKYGSHIER